MSERTYDWKRLWAPRGSLSLGDGEYLPDPESEYGSFLAANFRPLSTYLDKRLLVLLGEPGMGKSKALDGEPMTLLPRTSIGSDRILRVNLNQYGSEDRLCREVFEAEAIENWRQDGTVLHLFIDSLDECMLRIDTAAAILVDALRHLPCERLRLRIACRTTAWPALLEESLPPIFEDDWQALELMPLRQRDVYEAAKVEELDPPGFCAEVARCDAVAFAIKPVTLKFLIESFRRTATLPSEPAALYRQGCRLLCDEPNSTRTIARRSRTLSASQRVAVAQRIAALMTFCRKATIRLPGVYTSPTDDDLDIDAIVGGTETYQSVSVDVTVHATREALDTGLFSARGPNRIGFAHDTYREFLAAEFLVARNVSPDQIVGFLRHPVQRDRIIPQLRGVGAWLANGSEEVFGALWTVDPDAVMSADVGSKDRSTRLKLAELVLEQIDSGQIGEPWQRVGHYAQLAQPDLTDVLRRFLVDQRRTLACRRIALEIAKICRVDDLGNELTVIALDGDDNLDIRTAAAEALSVLGDGPAKLRLLPLLQSDGRDLDNELRASALKVLWPDLVDARTVFGALPPGSRPHHTGSYELQVIHICDTVSPGDLPRALEWASEYHDEPTFTLAMDALVRQAWQALDSPGVVEPFARFVMARITRYQSVVHSWSHVEGKIFEEAQRRRLLLDALLRLARQQGETEPWNLAHRLSYGSLPVLKSEDLAWAIERWRCASEDMIPLWTGVLRELVSRRLGVESLDPLLEACEVDANLASCFGTLFSPIELGSERARGLREEWRRPLQALDEALRLPKRAPLKDRVARALVAAETDLARFPDLQHEMLRANRRADDLGVETWDLCQSPGWKEAEDGTRRRVVDVARRYLCERRVDPQEWSHLRSVPLAAFAGYRALRLLFDCDRRWLDEASTDVWINWAPIVLCVPNLAREPEWVLDHAYRNAPTEVLSTFDALIRYDSDVHGRAFATDVMHRLWDAKWESYLSAKLELADLSAGAIGDIASDLIERGSAVGRQRALSLIPSVLPHAGREHDILVAVAVAALRYCPQISWDRVWNLIQQDCWFADRVLTKLAVLEWRQGVFAKKMPVEGLATLYIWLSGRFPQIADPVSDSPSVSERTQIAQFRDGLPRALMERGTANAYAALIAAANGVPDVDLSRILVHARESLLRQSWTAPTPSEFLALTEDPSKRLIHSAEHLAEVIVESLGRLQMQVHGERPSVRSHWDHQAHGDWWRPIDELTVSDRVANHLQSDIGTGRVVVNCEVQIRRKMVELSGQRTDIQVDATTFGRTGASERLTVIVEVKGCWNPEVETAMETQLRDRYLKNNTCRTGIYLVAWFTCKRWDPTDARQRKMPKWSLDDARRRFQQQAEGLTTAEMNIASFVLDLHIA